MQICLHNIVIIPGAEHDVLRQLHMNCFGKRAIYNSN